jgi:hypothetical protein
VAADIARGADEMRRNLAAQGRLPHVVGLAAVETAISPAPPVIPDREPGQRQPQDQMPPRG